MRAGCSKCCGTSPTTRSSSPRRAADVEIHISHESDRLRIAVQDTGCGIGPDFLPLVFDRFRQEDASPSRAASGLGLGLSIAKHLVELHGGTIQAWSAGPGSGATLAVEIPTTQHQLRKPAESERSKGGVMPASA